ncbi:MULTISPECIES: cupin domain-containing protein [unclassified Sphingomonas]|uniref:cupin domain-containing protein n=1 Tax=unclassified Sphingomonas TaxID=196159 RepID=UPI00092A9331|nr:MULTISPECIES: cupin domain-containing protein [unclassified Sphingomonas]MBN8848197.1 cupin domain-containing protein [Sphingomonas sp.]OJV34894.1 MAG: transcriptional regulator [Sphingomonas sp. 67-36]
MPRIDLATVPGQTGSGYPAPFDRAAGARVCRRLEGPGGISDFNITHVELPEGAWSSQRHWHEAEDEFLVMLSGAATLVDNHGETTLGAGDCVAFPKGDGNGHHLIGGPGGCVFVVWGVPEASACHYPDIDLALDGATGQYKHKDGTPY